MTVSTGPLAVNYFILISSYNCQLKTLLNFFLLFLYTSMSDVFDKENCFILAIARRVIRNILYQALYHRL